jgi:3-oxoacyl-[acyl-carrier-protein] synthase III
MEGNTVKRIAFEGMVNSARETLARNGLPPQALRAFIAHQANFRLLEALAESLELENAQH